MGLLAIVTLLSAACTSNGGSGTSSGSAGPSGGVGSSGGSPGGGTSSSAATTTPTGPSTDPATSAPASSTPVQGTVAPVVTYSGYDAASRSLQAAAYVDGVQQDTGGQCTLTVTAPDGVTSTTTRPATPDATTTQCGTLAVTPSALTPGSWSGTVSYTSASATGTSDPFTVEVTP